MIKGHNLNYAPLFFVYRKRRVSYYKSLFSY